MLRVVVDVNVLVSAVIGREGPPLQLLRLWRDGAFEALVSPLLLAELQRVLTRPELAARSDPAAVEALRAALRDNAVHADDPESAERIVKRDPKDDYLVALARTARAHAIVTGDAHLLEAEVEAVVRVVSPADFVALLETLPE